MKQKQKKLNKYKCVKCSKDTHILYSGYCEKCDDVRFKIKHAVYQLVP